MNKTIEKQKQKCRVAVMLIPSRTTFHFSNGKLQVYLIVSFFFKKNVAVNDPPITRKLCKPVLMIAG